MTPSPDLYSRSEIFVGGRWRPSVAGTEHKVVNPARGEVLGDAALAGAADDDAAVPAGPAAAAAAAAAARPSFVAGVGAGARPSERAHPLRAAVAYLEDLRY